jgi:phage shock protein PspC (stress-responsive transcriptional regulator)
VALVAWHTQVLVFDNVLLDNGLPGGVALGLSDSFGVQVSLWNVAIIAWNVIGDLSTSLTEFIIFIILLLVVLI